MTKTILALQSLLPAEMAVLDNKFNVIRLWESKDPEDTIKSHATEVSGVLSTYNGTGVNARLIEALPNLGIIAQFGVGYDNIDVRAATARNISVTNTPDVLTDDTADVGLFLLLNVARRAVEADMFVRAGRWKSEKFPLSTSLSGKKVGIVGLGKIGMAIAQRAKGFNMEILYYSRSKKDVSSYRYVGDVVTLAKESDFLVLACAGGPETRHLVDYKVLESLGPQGFLINIARGSVVKEDDLLAALSNKVIAGAGLDVFSDEPNVPEAMLKMDNVVLSPHVGSATRETRAIMGRLVIDNFCAYFDGKPLLTPVKTDG